MLSCDNLDRQRRGVAAPRHGLLPALPSSEGDAIGSWVEQNVSFPSSMVDRIVPATTDADRARTPAALLGVSTRRWWWPNPFGSGSSRTTSPPGDPRGSGPGPPGRRRRRLRAAEAADAQRHPLPPRLPGALRGYEHHRRGGGRRRRWRKPPRGHHASRTSPPPWRSPRVWTSRHTGTRCWNASPTRPCGTGPPGRHGRLAEAPLRLLGTVAGPARRRRDAAVGELGVAAWMLFVATAATGRAGRYRSTTRWPTGCARRWAPALTRRRGSWPARRA